MKIRHRHELDYNSRENEQDRMVQDGTERDWTVTVLGLKIPLITADEW